MDSGDLGDLTGYKEPERAMVGGLLLVAVRPEKNEEVSIRFTGEGLEPLVFKTGAAQQGPFPTKF